MRGVTLCLMLALVACGGSNDEDGDGIEAPLDCDDRNKEVYPGAVEVCDGVDNDCDGSIDDGLLRNFYPDDDGDGFGRTPEPQLLCEAPAGLVEAGGDCDDADAAIHPGAEEVCDDIDHNCDGDPSLGAPPLTWYLDQDSDGYGRDDITVDTCDPPPQYIATSGDCDDARADVNPGGTEICDGFDNDCNTVVDDNATDAITVYADVDRDGYGDDASGALGCLTQGVVDVGGDCDDADAAVNPGEVDVCDGGIDNDCDPTTDENVVDGDSYYADLDGDGFGDLTATVSGCVQPPYSSRVSGDCDDADPLTNPDGTEVCGGGDEDCDGQVDNGAADAISYYPDGDGDGFGDRLQPTDSCAPVPGLIVDGTDCDDTDPAINPDTVWYTDADRDGHGDAGAPVTGCLQPLGAVALDDDCDDADPTAYPGNIEICDGYVDNDCDPSTDEDLTATWYFDGDGDGFGTESNTVNGCTPPPGYVQQAGDCDDTAPEINPVDTPDCIQDHCGTIALSETWKNTVEHTVSCDVVVEGAAKPTLTVQDGAIVRFVNNAELRVGRNADGRILVQGATSGVLFTSDDPFPAPGDWDGLTIGARDQGSDLVGLTVEYAGNNGKGGIVIEGGGPVLDSVVSQWNLNDGLHITGSEPLVIASTFVNNSDNGVFVGVGAGLSRFDLLGTLGPSFQNNVILDNGGRPVTVPGSHADEIDLSNVLAPNAIDEIELLDGILRFTGTWYDHDIPYVVAPAEVIEVEDGPQAQLYIEDGVEVYFDRDAELRIGDGAEGYLEIVDGPEGVLFSATPQVVALSDNWNGLKFGPDDGGSMVRNLTIEYGGGNAKGNLWVVGSAPVFRDVVSRLSDSNGLYVSGATAEPDIADSSFVDNDEDGVFVESNSGIARSLLGPTFANNILTGNGGASVVMPPNFLGELDPSTTFVGNNERIGVHGGDVLRDALWRALDEDYQVAGDIDIGGPQDPVVQVEDGVSMWFQRNTRITAGVDDDGALVIDALNGVRFTSADAAPGEGDWHGIEIGNNGALSAQSLLRGLTIEYAGGNDVVSTGGGAIEIVDVDSCQTKQPLQTIEDVTIVGSSKSALWFESWTTIAVSDLTISGALDGCVQAYVQGSCPVPDVTRWSNVSCLDGPVFGTWPLALAEELRTGHTFPGPVVIDTAKLDRSVSMPALPVPYVFTGVTDVEGPGNPSLTIESGAELQFAPNAGLEVGDGGPAQLRIEPGVVLTSSQASPAPGDWDGVTIGDDITSLLIDGARISYGGGNFTAALWFDGSTPAPGSVSNTVVTDSSSYGVCLTAGSTVTLSSMIYAGNLLGNECP